MRLHILSDLHIEFSPFELPSTAADVVVLAGDIGVGTSGVDLALAQVKDTCPVVYVPGNHEFYGGSVDGVLANLRRAARGTHVHVLENEAVVLGGVRFLGCVLWTDFGALGEEPRAFHMAQAALAMNDYHHIQGARGRPLSPQDTLALNTESRAWLLSQLRQPFPGLTVVVTHHAAVRAAFPRWAIKNPTVVSACVNRMEDWMDGQHAAAWIHGHTHWGMDLRVRGTRVISNQRGYPRRPVPRFEAGAVYDINKGVRDLVDENQGI